MTNFAECVRTESVHRDLCSQCFSTSIPRMVKAGQSRRLANNNAPGGVTMVLARTCSPLQASPFLTPVCSFVHPGTRRWGELGGYVPPSYSEHPAPPPPSPPRPQPPEQRAFKRPRTPSLSMSSSSELAQSSFHNPAQPSMPKLQRDDLADILATLQDPIFKRSLDEVDPPKDKPKLRRVSTSSRPPPKPDSRMPPPLDTGPMVSSPPKYPEQETPVTATTPGTAITNEPLDPQFIVWRDSMK